MTDFRWGGLQHHWQSCPWDGDHEIDDDGEIDCEDGCSERLDRNDGSRGFFWGSFYANDRGECCDCKRDDVGIAAMFEPPDEWVCLDCYLRHHASMCGCELWPREVAA